MPGANAHTTVTNLEKGYRKTATKLYTAFKDTVEEFSWLDDIQDEEITPSGRENLIPLDVNRGYGAAMIPDGGYEARTVTPAMNEGSFSFVEASARFFISRFAQALDERARRQQIIRQITYQSKKALEALARRVGLQFYGFSTGIVADTSTNATQASGTYTIEDAFGVAAIDNAAYLASLFEVGDRVALIRSSALVANALGEITAKSAVTPSLTITWDGSVDADANDSIVFANAVTDAAITATDFGRWPVGVLDAGTSATVHGLATSAAPAWAAAINNSDGGRFSFVKRKKLAQSIQNASNGTMNMMIWAQGVENDVEAGERAARIYSSASMDLDGSVTVKGVGKPKTSPLVPPGYVFGLDKSGVGKKLLTDKPSEDGTLAFGDLFKAEDRSGWKGGFVLIYALIWRCRGKLGVYSGLSEQ